MNEVCAAHLNSRRIVCLACSMVTPEEGASAPGTGCKLVDALEPGALQPRRRGKKRQRPLAAGEIAGQEHRAEVRAFLGAYWRLQRIQHQQKLARSLSQQAHLSCFCADSAHRAQRCRTAARAAQGRASTPCYWLCTSFESPAGSYQSSSRCIHCPQASPLPHVPPVVISTENDRCLRLSSDDRFVNI